MGPISVCNTSKLECVSGKAKQLQKALALGLRPEFKSRLSSSSWGMLSTSILRRSTWTPHNMVMSHAMLCPPCFVIAIWRRSTSRTGRFLRTTSATLSGVTATARMPCLFCQLSMVKALLYSRRGIQLTSCQVSNVVQQVLMMKPVACVTNQQSGTNWVPDTVVGAWRAWSLPWRRSPQEEARESSALQQGSSPDHSTPWVAGRRIQKMAACSVCL